MAINKRLWLGWIVLMSLLPVLEASAAGKRYLYAQSTPSDCGPAALATLLHFYLDVPTTEKEIASLAEASLEIGTTLAGLENAALILGCSADSFRMTREVLQQQMLSYPAPVLVRMLNPEPHFVVLLAIKDNRFYVADPASGNLILSQRQFFRRWLLPGSNEGYVVLVDNEVGSYRQERQNAIVRELDRQMATLGAFRQPPRLPH